MSFKEKGDLRNSLRVCLSNVPDLSDFLAGDIVISNRDDVFKNLLNEFQVVTNQNYP